MEGLLIMSNSKNDERILFLKNQIQEKKNKLNKISRFSPITNCSIELDGIRYNINVLSNEQLISLLVKLNMYYMSAKDLNLSDTYTISGYLVKDWIMDIKTKINILSRKDEERSLKQMELKLQQLLSNDKKVELEINEIEKTLNNK